MSYLNGPTLARCNRCGGHVPKAWPRKSEHDADHHLADLCITPAVILACGVARREKIRNG